LEEESLYKMTEIDAVINEKINKSKDMMMSLKQSSDYNKRRSLSEQIIKMELDRKEEEQEQEQPFLIILKGKSSIGKKKSIKSY
jgi:hypothetical protein